MNKEPAVARATVSVEYDDGTTIVLYQEATRYKHIDVRQTNHGLDGTEGTIYFSAARGVRTMPDTTEQGRKEVAVVLDAAQTLTNQEPRHGD